MSDEAQRAQELHEHTMTEVTRHVDEASARHKTQHEGLMNVVEKVKHEAEQIPGKAAAQTMAAGDALARAGEKAGDNTVAAVEKVVKGVKQGNIVL